MKKTIIIALIVLALMGCNSAKKETTELQCSVSYTTDSGRESTETFLLVYEEEKFVRLDIHITLAVESGIVTDDETAARVKQSIVDEYKTIGANADVIVAEDKIEAFITINAKTKSQLKSFGIERDVFVNPLTVEQEKMDFESNDYTCEYME